MSVPSKDEEDATEDEEAVRMLQFTRAPQPTPF